MNHRGVEPQISHFQSESSPNWAIPDDTSNGRRQIEVNNQLRIYEWKKKLWMEKKNTKACKKMGCCQKNYLKKTYSMNFLFKKMNRWGVEPWISRFQSERSPNWAISDDTSNGWRQIEVNN